MLRAQFISLNQKIVGFREFQARDRLREISVRLQHCSRKPTKVKNKGAGSSDGVCILYMCAAATVAGIISSQSSFSAAVPAALFVFSAERTYYYCCHHRVPGAARTLGSLGPDSPQP